MQTPPRASSASLSAVKLFLIMCAGTLAFAASARAADWVERPFDPPVGSRWIIQSDETTEENRDGRVQTSTMKMTSEFTIEAKVAEGFRVTHVVRSAVYEGDARLAAIIGPVTKTLENLVVRATTGPNGMPLRVDNLAEVQAAARAAIDGMVAAFASKPEVAATLRKMMMAMLVDDQKQATKLYLGDLQIFALGQNTGLHPGETRRDSDEAPNPLGGTPLKSSTTLRIDRIDPATGNVRLIRTRTFDADAMKEFLNKMMKQMGGVDGKDTQKFEAFMKQLTIALDGRAEIDVEGGMTRAVREEDTTTASIMGHSMVKREHKLTTITRAP